MSSMTRNHNNSCLLTAELPILISHLVRRAGQPASVDRRFKSPNPYTLQNQFLENIESVVYSFKTVRFKHFNSMFSPTLIKYLLVSICIDADTSSE